MEARVTHGTTRRARKRFLPKVQHGGRAVDTHRGHLAGEVGEGGDPAWGRVADFVVGEEDGGGEIGGLGVELAAGVGECAEGLGMVVRGLGIGVVGEDLVEDFLGEIEDAAVGGRLGGGRGVGFGEAAAFALSGHGVGGGGGGGGGGRRGGGGCGGAGGLG